MVDPVTPPPVEKPWHEGLSAEDVGFLQNRGWDKLPPRDAAVKAMESYREAAKFTGAPPDKLIRLPDNMADGEAMKPVWSKLGVPSDKAGYDLSAIKNADGSALSQEFVDFIQTSALNRQLTKDAALGLAADMIKRANGEKAEQVAVNQAKLLEEKTALDKLWGPNKDLHLTVAKQAALALGIPPEAISALESQIGYKAVMEMMRNIGSKIGEDKFIMNNVPGGPTVMTHSQAQARKSELMRDTAWASKYLAGDTAAAREMLALNQIIVSQAA